ncbi:MAG: hypothetical protein K2X03_17865 [Bryobacteraceae bacterium]|nr:hypothetical protein [Bryobacteraceae bacterium]
MARPVQRRQGERGFALLFVFVMAAAISIGLYMELPRAVFEAQRAKEETLFDRGEQYKTGIKRYYTKFQRYPNTIEELEQTNGTRYLRRRYKDPFTGKDDWKILKFGPGGEIEGSVHNKKKTDKDGPQSTGSVSAGPTVGETLAESAERLGGPGGAQDRNPALNRRPSDTGIGAQLANGANGGGAGPAGQLGPQGQPQGQVSGQLPGVYGQGQYGQPNYNQPGQYPNNNGFQGAPNPNLPNQNQGLPGAAPNPYGQNGNPNFTGNQPNSGQLSPYPQQQFQGQQFPGQQFPGQGGNRLPGGLPSSPYPGLPGQAANSQQGGQIGVPFGNGVGAPGQNGQNPALQMINNLLTQPRQGIQVGGLAGGQLGGAMPTGIAGVVSKHKGQGIKVLEERTKIHEWEFVYDVRKDKSLQKGAMGQQNGGRLPGSGLNNSSGVGSNSNGFGQQQSGQQSGFQNNQQNRR